MDVESLWCASTGGTKREEESFFIFLVLEDVARLQGPFCSTGGAALGLAGGATF